MYRENLDQVTFTARVAKDIERAFKREHNDFVGSVREWLSIDPQKVKRSIEKKISKFFDTYRRKIDDLEDQVVEKVENSINLEKLINTTVLERESEEVVDLPLKQNLEYKYDADKEEFEDKIKNGRFTYICLEKDGYDETIDRIVNDNKMLAKKIRDAKRLIDSIFDVALNEERVDLVINKLTADQMLIDEKKPDFGVYGPNSMTQFIAQDSQDELIPERVKAAPKSQAAETQAVYLSEEMNSFYSIKENSLFVRELEENEFVEHKLFDLKLYLQKVITVPTETENIVYLIGGSKDSKGKDVVDETYEVDFTNRQLKRCSKMSSPKVSMAAGLSPDCKYIIIAGGSEGYNLPTNTSEVFDIETQKWRKLPSLNCPRMSASLIVCTQGNVFCFGGIDNNPEDPSIFLPLKSIEWLKYEKSDEEWETLKIKLPFKSSSSGSICMGENNFIVFGGWNRNTLSKSAFIWYDNISGFNIEEAKELEKSDSFLSSGLTRRDPIKKQTIIFGVSYCHMYDELKEEFTILPIKNEQV